MIITVEEIEANGMVDIVGFTEDGISFLHLTKEEFKSASYVGEQRLVSKMISEYYQYHKYYIHHNE